MFLQLFSPLPTEVSSFSPRYHGILKAQPLQTNLDRCSPGDTHTHAHRDSWGWHLIGSSGVSLATLWKQNAENSEPMKAELPQILNLFGSWRTYFAALSGKSIYLHLLNTQATDFGVPSRQIHGSREWIRQSCSFHFNPQSRFIPTCFVLLLLKPSVN